MITISQWRASIGGFSGGRRKTKTETLVSSGDFKNVKLSYHNFFVITILCLGICINHKSLMLSGDIELNPGPNTGELNSLQKDPHHGKFFYFNYIQQAEID